MKGSAMELRAAIRRNDLTGVKREIAAGAKVNAKSKGILSPAILAWAAETPSVCLETLRALVAAGANPLIEGGEVIRRAARTGDLERVKLFAELGCPLLEVGPNGYTTLHSATLTVGPPSIELVRFLLESGCDPSARTKWNETPIGYSLHSQRFENARLLLERGAMRNDPTWPCIFTAILFRDFQAIETYRAEVNQEFFSFGQWSPVQVAMRMGDLELVTVLASLGADLSFRDRGGYGLLYHAIVGGSLEVLDWCFEHVCGGKISEGHSEGAHQAAAESGRVEVAKWLFDREVPMTDDMSASPLHSCHTPEIADFYLAHGEGIDGINGEGYSVLMSAAGEGDVEMATHWIRKGADVEATSTGATALHHAVWADSDEIVDLLIQAGANVDALDVDGDPPLIYTKSLAVARKLIAAGADVDQSHWAYGSVRKGLLKKDVAFTRLLA